MSGMVIRPRFIAPVSYTHLDVYKRQMEDYFKFRGWRSITRTVGYDWVQLNHYAVKSVDSYAIRKMRGNVNNKADKYNSCLLYTSRCV